MIDYTTLDTPQQFELFCQTKGLRPCERADFGDCEIFIAETDKEEVDGKCELMRLSYQYGSY